MASVIFAPMHIEVFIVRVKILRTNKIEQYQLCFEVGETEEDRDKLLKEFQKELSDAANNESYKLLGYVSKKLYLKD